MSPKCRILLLTSLMVTSAQGYCEEALFASPQMLPPPASTDTTIDLKATDPEVGWSQLVSRGAIMMLSAQNNDQAVAGAELLRRAGEYYGSILKSDPSNRTKNRAPAIPEISPTGRNLLATHGVDPAGFSRQLMRGEFATHEDVLNAAGIQSDLEDDDVDRGIALAEAELRGTFGEKATSPVPPKGKQKEKQNSVASAIGEKIQTTLKQTESVHTAELPPIKIGSPHATQTHIALNSEDIISNRKSSNVFRLAGRHFRAWRHYGNGNAAAHSQTN